MSTANIVAGTAARRRAVRKSVRRPAPVLDARERLRLAIEDLFTGKDSSDSHDSGERLIHLAETLLGRIWGNDVSFVTKFGTLVIRCEWLAGLEPTDRVVLIRSQETTHL